MVGFVTFHIAHTVVNEFLYKFKKASSCSLVTFGSTQQITDVETHVGGSEMLSENSLF